MLMLGTLAPSEHNLALCWVINQVSLRDMTWKHCSQREVIAHIEGKKRPCVLLGSLGESVFTVRINNRRHGTSPTDRRTEPDIWNRGEHYLFGTMVPADAWVLTEPCPASKPGCWPWKASVLEQSTVRGNAIVRKNSLFWAQSCYACF